VAGAFLLDLWGIAIGAFGFPASGTHKVGMVCPHRMDVMIIN